VKDNSTLEKRTFYFENVFSDGNYFISLKSPYYFLSKQFFKIKE